MELDSVKILQSVRKSLKKLNLDSVTASMKRDSLMLEGQVKDWESYMKAGFAAADTACKGVVNDIEVDGLEIPGPSIPEESDKTLEGREFDVVIIGGGITGSAIASRLSRWDLSVCVLEKEYDVAVQTSSRNDGMVHPGFAANPDSLKARLNIKANPMYTEWSKDLGFDLIRPGSLILMHEFWYRFVFGPVFNKRAKKGIPGVTWLSRREVLRRVPALDGNFYGAFWFPSTGCVSPYKTTIAVMEHAIQNGAELFLNTVLTDLAVENGMVSTCRTNRGTFKARLVINAAGVWADKVAEMADDRFFSIHPRKGEVIILDKKTKPVTPHVIARPVILGSGSTHTKGGGVVPTVEGNLLLGPNAVEQPYREDYENVTSRY
jgi:glycerol-3-phosphate dehydrogenase